MQVFVGSSTKIYKLNNTTLNLEDVSKSGGYGGNSAHGDLNNLVRAVIATNGSQ